MSGYPNVPDVVELRSCLLSLKMEDEAIVRATHAKARAEKDIVESQARARGYAERIDKLMSNMDCAQPGNLGYKNRLLVLLTTLSEASG
jgi:hypothetical protein